MRISCDRSALLKAVSTAQAAVSPRSTIQALEGILLKAEPPARVNLCGYDLEVGISCDIEADVEKPGAIVLGARMFGDIVRRLPEGRVAISADEKNVTTITCGMSEFTIMGTPAGEFPEMPVFSEEKTMTLKQETLKDMIEQTIFAVAQNDARPALTGSLFEVEGDTLRIVSVDGYRLALREEKIDREEGENFSFIVPGKALGEISRLLERCDRPVKLNLGKKHIMFEADGFVMISRLLEGEFLNYRNSIPKEFKLEAEVDVRSFIDSVERASLVISEKAKSPVRCLFDIDSLKVSCHSPQGKVFDEFEIKCSGGPMEIGFNNRYLLDALKASGQERVRIEAASPLSPMVIRKTEGEGLLFLVVPVRLKNEG